MDFFNSAVGVLQTLVIALGAGLGIWGVINLLEGYQTENFYAVLERQRQLEKEVSAIVNGKRKTRRKQA